MSGRDPAEAGARIEALLRELDADAGPAVTDRVEEVVRLLVGLYGEALARVTAAVAGAGPAGEAALADLSRDPLVGSLFAVHDLHPVPLVERVAQALESVRPYLGSHAGDVELLGVTDEGDVSLRLAGTCHGCPASSVTVTTAVERAIRDAAPEVGEISVEGLVPAEAAEPSGDSAGGLPLLQISPRPPVDGVPPRNGPPVSRPAAPSAARTAWVPLDRVTALSADRLSRVHAGGTALVALRLGDTVYAYREGCPSCSGSLDGAPVQDEVAACPSCVRHFDVHLAGRAVEGGPPLEPVPLLADGDDIRVALPVDGAMAGSLAAEGAS